ncbi:molybdopterin molybdotransferase MoeA [Paenibacillus glycinis]|uniref:Molybdopterin molybdenumtransferase n=1 Tax=Paenibacillus glycinis TaxID=2697035 RepID=A0ABW9XZP0_9BACL|nr:molybdopterin molybdotransferase MoeA [Paenibacillus glycinis]NBD27719.1 hypothetical protein [Paenibacillus glycinis]
MNERQQGEARFRRRAVKVDEALRLVLEAAVPERTEIVPLWEAGGRRLAEAVSATTDWPPFARAGLDGFAVRSADTAQASPGAPATLRVVDTVAAGALASADVAPGTAVRIMTGGAVPSGADAVVMLEQTADARVFGQPAVQVKSAAEPGQNIAPRGEEFGRGRVFGQPGELLRPGHVALLGTFGYAHVPVYARPRVAVLATGAELLPVEAPLAPGRIRDSNSAMVASLVAQCGGTPILCGRVPDEPVAVAQAIANALAQCDIVITTGGVSVGDYDVMATLLQSIGNERSTEEQHEAAPSVDAEPSKDEKRFVTDDEHACAVKVEMQDELDDKVLARPMALPQEDAAVMSAVHSKVPSQYASTVTASPHSEEPLHPQDDRLPSNSRLLFNKAAMRPGAPTSAAVVSGKLLIALSGNPGACFVGFELFARAAILRLSGASREEARPKQATAKLVGSFDKGSPHERFVRARLYTENGTLYADPLAFGKSSMMASLPAADGLIRIKAGSVGAAEGSIVNVILLGALGYSTEST